ncbi:MAG: hypothetical protein AAF481_06330 [Acidobacteriota bacterium]
MSVMKKTVLCLALVSLLALGGSAFAELCTVDDVPAATLLLPYFEVDLDSDSGITTLFSVNNASAAPVLAHVTLWTDLSVPTIDFDLYLTGYDVQSFNVRDIFNGTLPQTGPDDSLSNRGAFSDPHAVPASCTGGFPVGNIPPSLVQLLEEAHTGQSVARFSGSCAGVNHGDNIARGYITVDLVRECSVDFPTTPGYFDDTAGFDNVLWGDYFYVDPSNDFAQGETLVHIEANQQAFAPGDYTFYGRYVAFTAADAREPLSTTFGVRYLNGGVFSGGTDLICWRDAKVQINPFACGGVPNPFPLAQTQVVIFDEEENPELVPESRISPGNEEEEILVCPWEAQRRAVDFATPDFGWLYLNLNTTVAGAGVNPIAQAWVTAVMSAEGRYSVGFDAITLSSACSDADITLPVGGDD